MAKLKLDIGLQPKQRLFYESTADEVLFGGAAGGGKTYVQCADALIYALKYPGSRQILFRRTYPELERSVLPECYGLFPRKPYARYNATQHQWRFSNDSIIDLGYLARDSDRFLYQGAQYDVVRFDEATHFTFDQVDYLRSRIRGVTPYPRSMRLSTNPGGVGHLWIKERFVDPAPPGNIISDEHGTTRQFIQAFVQDNYELMEKDPQYLKNLESMGDENLKRALLYGDWNIFEGQFFSEFTVSDHVIEPFDLSSYRGARFYRAIDYGLDMLACLWICVLPKSEYNPCGSVIIYRELCEPNLTISTASEKIREFTGKETITQTFAPPDVMNNRDRLTGRNQGDIFLQNGLSLSASNNDRAAGWLAVKELLKLQSGGRPILKIFSTCRNLIKCLPALQYDVKKSTDCLKEPHEITHSPDALRYFAVQWTRSNPVGDDAGAVYVVYPPDLLEDYTRASPHERISIEKMMGGKPDLKRKGYKYL